MCFQYWRCGHTAPAVEGARPVSACLCSMCCLTELQAGSGAAAAAATEKKTQEQVRPATTPDASALTAGAVSASELNLPPRRCVFNNGAAGTSILESVRRPIPACAYDFDKFAVELRSGGRLCYEAPGDDQRQMLRGLLEPEPSNYQGDVACGSYQGELACVYHVMEIS